MFETPNLNNNPKKETEKSFRIEHLPDFDVMVNLNYPHPEDPELIIGVLKRRPGTSFYSGYTDPRETSIRDQTVLALERLKDPEKKEKFFVKKKTFTDEKTVDYLSGRKPENPVSIKHMHDFDLESIRAAASITSEMRLVEKIKKLVQTEEFQSLAKEKGFTEVSFLEPIVSFIHRKSGAKFVVYERLHNFASEISPERAENHFSILEMVWGLRDLFRQHGITPHDLREEQLLVAKKNGQRSLFLIDIEAYTEEK